MKRTVIPILLLLLFMTTAVAVEKPLGVEEYTSVDELAVAISTYFPKVQGEIKAVKGDHLTLSLATKDSIMPGMTLTVWRDGKDILHPVTGEPMVETLTGLLCDFSFSLIL